MTNDHHVWVGNFFFDVQLDRAATQLNRAGNIFLGPFVFLVDIGDYCSAASAITKPLTDKGCAVEIVVDAASKMD